MSVCCKLGGKGGIGLLPSPRSVFLNSCIAVASAFAACNA